MGRDRWPSCRTSGTYKMKTQISPSAAFSTELLMIRSDGSETHLTICIGFPYKQGQLWLCPCQIDGLEPQYPDMAGDTSIQALCLALKIVRTRLLSVINAGHTICLPLDRGYPLDRSFLNMMFGVD